MAVCTASASEKTNRTEGQDTQVDHAAAISIRVHVTEIFLCASNLLPTFISSFFAGRFRASARFLQRIKLTYSCWLATLATERMQLNCSAIGRYLSCTLLAITRDMVNAGLMFSSNAPRLQRALRCGFWKKGWSISEECASSVARFGPTIACTQHHNRVSSCPMRDFA